jgi:hypothetical protein
MLHYSLFYHEFHNIELRMNLLSNRVFDLNVAEEMSQILNIEQHIVNTCIHLKKKQGRCIFVHKKSYCSYVKG